MSGRGRGVCVGVVDCCVADTAILWCIGHCVHVSAWFVCACMRVCVCVYMYVYVHACVHACVQCTH